MFIAMLMRRLKWLHSAREKVAESPIAYRLARGAFWSLVGGVTARIFTMISSVIVARFLGKEGFGELGIVQSTLGLFGTVAGFGLGATATKYIAEYRQKNPRKAANITSLTIVFSLLSGILMAVLCFGMSSLIAGRVLGEQDLTNSLAAGALLLFSTTLSGVVSAALSGFEAFRRMATINIVQGIAAPIVAVPLVWLYGLQGAIAALTVNAAIGLLLLSKALDKEAVKSNINVTYNKRVWAEWPILWKYSLPAMLSGMVVIPVVWLSNVILIRQPGGYSELGLFNAANQWRSIIVYLPGLLSSAMLPVLSETYGRKDISEFRRAVELNLRITWILALPLTVIAIILNKPLAAIFGQQFMGADSIIVLLMISVFFTAIGSTVGTALAGSGEMWTGTAMNMGWAFVLVLSSIFFIPHFAAKGLAAAYFFAYLIHTIWVVSYLDIKLAPTAIRTQWPLIVFTVLLLGVSSHISLNANDTDYGYQIAVIFASFIPILNSALKKDAAPHKRTNQSRSEAGNSGWHIGK